MEEEKIIAYKGMDKDMKCRGGFQYEVGKEYETEKADACKAGFHACEYPLDVFNYFPPATSRFFLVEQSGMLSRDSDDTKVASTKIKIGAEIGIPGLVKAAIEYTKSKTIPEKSEHATGEQGAAAATGEQGAAAATGWRGAAAATGWRGAAAATGEQGAAAATGDRGAAAATGWQGAAAATGWRGAAAATGWQGAAAATGWQGAAAATGWQGAAAATGDRGAAAATGEQGAAAATGDRGAASVEKSGVALASGICGKAKGKIGCGICVVERGEWDGNTYPIVAIKAAIVDGVEIKEDTYYTLKNGEFVEAE